MKRQDSEKFDQRADVFKGLPKLRKLILSENGISDLGVLRLIAGAKELEELQAGGTNISDQSLEHLMKCPKLQLIEVTRSRVTGAGIVALKGAVAKQKRAEIMVMKDGVKH